jgi:pimeloyl-ACP methyl ester carboxylesterase
MLHPYHDPMISPISVISLMTRYRSLAGKSPPAGHSSTPWFHDEDVKAPNAFMLMLEGRAPWELAALVAAMPWLKRLPRGDGHGVIVFPGLGANDATTAPLRGFLQELGYSAYPWRLGFNLGPRNGVMEGLRDLHRRTFERHGGKVSLLGWSLGGLYARELAKEQPEWTRCVITLGTPFAGHPRATNAWRFYEMVSGQSVHDAALIEQLKGTPTVPTTSLYSKSDGVVAWQCSLNPEAPHAENIEVHASHIGMGMNPLALYAIADRLRQDPAHWQRFDAQGARRWFFKTTGLSPMQAAQ